MQTASGTSMAEAAGHLIVRGLCWLAAVVIIALLVRSARRKQAPQNYPAPPYPAPFPPPYGSPPAGPWPAQLPADVGPAQPPAGNRKITLWSENGLHVSAVLLSDGTLEFMGHDLNPTNPWGAEYEYAITVAPADVPRVVAALGGPPGTDVLALLALHGAQIVRSGEQSWLRSLGIEPGFSSRVGDEL